jgi:ribosome biogenesis GTPase YqeH
LTRLSIFHTTRCTNPPYIPLISLTCRNYSKFRKIRRDHPSEPVEVKPMEKSKLPEVTLSELPKMHEILSGSAQCVGCGAQLQLKEADKPGYIEQERLDRFISNQSMQAIVQTKIDAKEETIDAKDLEQYEKAKKTSVLVCKRCHQLKNYGKMISLDISAEDFKGHIQKLKDRRVLVVQIIDLFDVENSFIPDLNEWVGDNPILLVGNKVDLLPRGASLLRVESWLRRQARKSGLNIVDCMLTSSKGIAIKDFARKIEILRENRDVYVVGTTNVGKSSLINQFLAEVVQTAPGEKPVKRLTESSLPGTTLKPISVRIGKGHKKSSSFLFDTPGMMNPHLPTNYLDPDEWTMVYPTKRIQPVFFRMKPGRTIFLGGLARIDFVSNEVRDDWQRIIFATFISANLPLHTTSMEKADGIYQKRLGDLIFPPKPGNIELTPLVEKGEWTFESFSRKQAFTDICISGLGWVSLSGVGRMKFKVYAPEKLKVFIREPLMPFETLNLEKNDLQDG